MRLRPNVIGLKHLAKVIRKGSSRRCDVVVGCTTSTAPVYRYQPRAWKAYRGSSNLFE